MDLVVRPDKINVLVVGFPDPNYLESELKKKQKKPTTSLKNIPVRRHALFCHLKNRPPPLPPDQSKFVLHSTTCL